MKTSGKLRLLFPLSLAVIALGLGGCIVQSVYPFYTTKDLIFDTALLGNWSDNDTAAADETWHFEKLGENAYLTTLTGKSETNRFEARLFHLRQQKFLDLYTVERKEHHLPLHYIFKVEQIQPTLKISAMASGWLEELLAKDPKAIRHVLVPKKPGSTEQGDLILTAETKELQEFVLKHSTDTNAFGEPTELKRRK